MLSRWIQNFHNLIHKPSKVFLFCAVITFLLILVDGSLWKYWSLQRHQGQILERMGEIKEKSKKLEFQIHEAKKLTYIERQATDQFDYVRESDLIFIFSE